MCNSQPRKKSLKTKEIVILIKALFTTFLENELGPLFYQIKNEMLRSLL